MICKVGHTIECNNFTELDTTDECRVQPKHVVRRKGDNNKLHYRRKYIVRNKWYINAIGYPEPVLLLFLQLPLRLPSGECLSVVSTLHLTHKCFIFLSSHSPPADHIAIITCRLQSKRSPLRIFLYSPLTPNIPLRILFLGILPEWCSIWVHSLVPHACETIRK
jgi:hypothetical protein